ncbi:DUF4129 domain-containing protein [Streptomyces sp. L7]
MPSYTQSNTPGSDIPDPAGSSAATSTAPSAAPSASESCTAPAEEDRGLREPGPGARGGRRRQGPVVVSAGVAAEPGRAAAAGDPVLADALADPDALGTAGAHGRTAADAAMHTLAVWEELTDTAWDFGISPDDSLTPRKAAARIVRLGHLDPPTAASVHRVADAVEQVLYAPRPQLAAGLAQDVRRVVVGFQDTASRSTRLRALVAPRSTVRVVWELSAWWASVTARAAEIRPTLRKPSGQQG